MEYSQALKIPRGRIRVLIGKNGETKKKIEEETNSKIKISKSGEVHISGNDSISVWIARKIVRAIGEGFNPEYALLLKDENYDLNVIELKEFAKSKKDEIRLRGRLIGSEGKTRKQIERMTETYISIYGKNIAIIGKHENLAVAREAIVMLLTGSMHGSVYRYLERERRKLKMMKF